MNNRAVRAILIVIAAMAVVAAVGFAAYHFGTVSGGDGHVVFGPMRGFRGFMGYGAGWGFFGLIPFLILGALLAWLVVSWAGGWGHGSARPPLAPPAATKRRLLGL